jgi:hypothetical protein
MSDAMSAHTEKTVHAEVGQIEERGNGATLEKVHLESI